MKKIILLLFMALVPLCTFAQLPEGFEGTWPPAGWGIYDNDIGTNYSWVQANGGPLPAHTGDHAAYMREENVVAGLAEDWLTTPLVEVPADPQLIFWSRMTQNNNQGATFEVRLSTDPDQSNLSAYTEVLGEWTETELNPIQTTYTQIIVPIPDTYVGQDVFIAFVRIGDEGDRWLIDDVNLLSECFEPTDLAADDLGLSTATLSWANPGGATSWEIEILPVDGVPSGAGVIHNGTPSYIADGLVEDTCYKYYVRALCDDGANSEWAGPFNFCTVALGATCDAPIVITTPNYTATGDTSDYGNDYSGTPGTACGTGFDYLSGDDVVYAYTAAEDGTISVSLTGLSDTYAGIFVYTSCADIGTACYAGDFNGSSTADLLIDPMTVTEDITYYIVISTWPAPQSTEYTLTIQQVFCAPPVGNPAENVDNNSADLSWTNPSSATSWEVVVQEAGLGLPTGAGTTVNTTPEYPATGLDEATNYEYYVRAACGDGNFSAWAGPYTFTTTQVPATMDYTQDFEGTHGWAINNGSQTNKWVVGTAVANGGTQSLYVSNDNGVSNNYTDTATSVVHAYRDIQMPAVVDQVSVSYDWRFAGETCCDFLRVWLVPVSYVPTPGTEIPGGGERIQLGTHNGNADWSTENQVIDASDYAGEIVRLVFEWDNDHSVGVNPAAAIDNVNMSVITCPAPSDLAYSGLTEDEVTFTWEGPSSVTPTFDYYRSETNTPPTEGTTPTGNTADETVTMTGLTPSTLYYFWVRSHCGPDDTSFWIGPVNFTTTQVPAEIDFTDDFEGTNDWSLLNGTGTNQWISGTAVSNGGTQSLYITNDAGVSNAYTDNAYTVIHAYRDIQIPDGLTDDMSLSFDWRAVGESCCDYLRVWVVPSTFVPVSGNEINGGSGGDQLGGNFNGSSIFTTANYVLPAADYEGQVIRLVFEWVNNGGTAAQPPAAVDNINLKVITCPAPSDLALDAISQDEATFTWEAPATGTPTYDYYLSETNTSVGDGTIPTGNTTSATVTLDVEPSTVYYFWVRSNCGTDDTSYWIGPLNFTSPQIPADLNYTEDFEDTIAWTLLNTGQNNKWVVGTAVANGGTHSLYITNDDGASNAYNINSGSSSVVHAYRDIQLPGDVTEIDLSFDWRAVGEGFGWDHLRVWLVPVTFTPTEGTMINNTSGGIQFGGDFNLSGEWVTANFIQDVSAYAGQAMRLVFQWRNDGGGGAQPPAAVDNIDITIVTCPKPTNLTADNITQTSAEFEWTEAADATAWEIYVAEEDAPAPTLDTEGIPAPEHPFEYNGLIPGTPQKYYVRAVCAEDDKSKWAGPFFFITEIGNDECAGAVTVPVNPTEECVEVTPALFDGATVSAEAGTCSTTNGGDIWFEFTAESTSHVVELSNFSGTPDPVILTLYEGDECGTLTQMYCSYNNVIMASGLVPGNIYKVRASLAVASPDLTTTFDICVNTPPPPANNNQQECVITTINFDFETPGPPAPTIYPHFVNHNVVQGWRTTAADEEMEFWSAPNYESVPAYSGSQFIELNANLVSGVYQDYETPQPTVFSYGFAHRGRQGTDTCELLAGPPGGPYTTVTTATTTNSAWVYYTGNYTVPAGQTVTRFIFQSVSSVGGVSVGNYLDAITFTANNGLLSENPMALNCENNIANVSAAGVGAWTAHADNPAATVIGDAELNDTTISGFTVSGTYLYDWTTQYCTSTLEITYNGGDVAEPVTITEVAYCLNEEAEALTAEALPDHTLNWYAADNTPLTGAPTPATTTEGETVYYVSQTSTEGCESPRVAITVTVNGIPAAPETDDVSYCVGSDATPLTAVALPDHTLNWYTQPAGGTPLAEAPTPSTAEATTITYYVSQSPAAGCEGARASIEVTIVPNPDVTTPGNQTVCDSYTLPQLALGNYFTSPGGVGAIDAGSAITSTATLYVYAESGTTPNCTDEESFTITILESPVADAPSDVTVCDLYTLPALSAGNNYFTEPGGQGTMLAAGSPVVDTQTVYVFTSNGTCSDENSFTVTIVPTPIIEGISEGCEGNEYVLGVVFDADEEFYTEDNVDYEWTSETGIVLGTGATLVVESAGTYHVKVSPKGSDLGCYVEGSIIVTETSCLIPRGISPNGDEYNQSFDLSSFDVRRLSVFNRYGTEVYSFSGAYTNQWEGQANGGDELPTGTYFYMMERANGESKTGWVYINREE